MRNNNTQKIGDNSLLETYNFTDGSRTGVLISQSDIRKIRTMDFYNVPANIVEVVLEAAGIYDAVEDLPYNFVIYEDGKIELGGDMCHIASNRYDFERAWRHFQTRKYFNVITLELEGAGIVKSYHNIDGN